MASLWLMTYEKAAAKKQTQFEIKRRFRKCNPDIDRVSQPGQWRGGKKADQGMPRVKIPRGHPQVAIDSGDVFELAVNVSFLYIKAIFGREVLGILHPKFHYLSSHFVVFSHGQSDLSSLPCLGGAAVLILLKLGEYCVAGSISSRETHYWCSFPSKPMYWCYVQPCTSMNPLNDIEESLPAREGARDGRLVARRARK